MRVIAGIARGQILAAPKGLKTRPTGDRMKEDLFNILAPLVEDAKFLDLYCGSGAMGIEALSRGAAEAVFVDVSKEALLVCEANLKKVGLCDAELLCMTGLGAVKELSRRLANKELANRKFDIIFMDPPYDSTELVPVLEFIDQSLNRDNGLTPLIDHKGIVVAECPSDYTPPELYYMELYRRKKYTQMQFLFYRSILL